LDEPLWSLIDQLAFRINRTFSLDELQSIIPSYYEIGRIGAAQEKLFRALEKRLKELKEEQT
jgi:hypothetical protein